MSEPLPPRQNPASREGRGRVVLSCLLTLFYQVPPVASLCPGPGQTKLPLIQAGRAGFRRPPSTAEDSGEARRHACKAPHFQAISVSVSQNTGPDQTLLEQRRTFLHTTPTSPAPPLTSHLLSREFSWPGQVWYHEQSRAKA